MGGKGAKERRRLARLAANGDGGQDGKQSTSPPAPKGAGTSNHRNMFEKGYPKKEQNRFPHQSSRPPFAGRPGAGDASIPRFAKRHNDRQRPRANMKTEPKKKKPKVKKPKHLKRKIDKLSEEDDAERQRLVDELNQFEARKSAMASKPSTKRQKQSIPNISAARAKVRENVLVEKKESKVDETPRQVVAAAAADDDSVKEDSATPAPTAKTDPVAKNVPNIVPATEDDLSSDSDSDISLEDATKRQRGRRRRGRKSTDEQSKSVRDDSRPEESAATSEERTSNTEVPTESPEMETEEPGDCSKKTPKKHDKRRCIGRKPVTDFVVGQRYSGKVVYTKQFGAFIDVGCHSDAFCHVSRVRDDYVESINDALSIGEQVSARVVEVDRKGKRITVSLQSDARIEDERASVEARRERKEKNGKGKRSRETTSVGEITALAPPPSPAKQNALSPPAPLDESMMTPAELKRARKLARRAARREQQAQTGLAA